MLLTFNTLNCYRYDFLFSLHCKCKRYVNFPKRILHAHVYISGQLTRYYSEYTRTIGSGEDLGLLGSQYYSATTTVSETAPGYFEKGSKCGSDGDCITAKNREHIDAGRAYECGSSWFPQACAVGTDQVLGYASQYYDPGSSVKETAGGWELCE